MTSSKILMLMYNDYIKPKKRIILVVFLVIIFLIASYYAYKLFATPVFENATGGQDVANANSRTSDVQVYFFFATWCPYCKKAGPEWDAFAETYDGTTLSNSTIQTTSVDCTDGTSPMIQKYQINGYPTVFAMKNGNRIDFDSKITESALVQFVGSL